MSRPLRIEFPGALYHVTSRGDRREDIFEDDADRARLLAVVAQGLQRFDAVMLAYCLMGNHYHFVVQTRQANLSLLMRHINGVYSQAYNRRHGKVGHVFQGRFKAILVDEDAYLLEVCRYVELNPVRAGMVAQPGDWAWSSYRAHVGQAPGAPWLDTAGLHGYLLGQDADTPALVAQAQQRYAEHVAAGRGVALWDEALNRQIYLGDHEFVQRMLDAAAPPATGHGAKRMDKRREQQQREVPKAQRQRQRPRTLAWWLKHCPTREEALRRAHTEGGQTMTALAQELGLTVARVSQLVAKAERALAAAAAAPDAPS